MDIATLNTKDAGEAGRFLHFCRPGTNERLMDGGEKVGAMVRSFESETVRAVVRAQQKLPEHQREEEDAGIAIITACVVSFVNATRGETPLRPTEEDVRWFIDQSEGLGLQIVVFAKNLGNFGAAPSTASSSRPVKKAS